MVDIHSHVLPGIDDGADVIEKTLEMLKIASEDGTKNIVATPHFYTGYYDNKYEDICKLTTEVNNIAQEKGMDINIISGQEVFLDKHTLEFYNEGIVGCIGETKYMLIELSMKAIPKDALDMIYELRLQGIKPIIAHPERYSYIIEKPSTINDFINEGCLFQINTGSIKGLFGKTVKKTAETLIQHGICNFIASDAHTIKSRCPGLKEALHITKSFNKKLSEEVIENGYKLLNNDYININGEKIKEKKSFFSFFKK
ncbi:tyrosine-protein phosphatase [Clostridium sp. DJ247]|uniref:tyrosine-protein phosphatase n=1 Tax=Clostridium sp. DJ247 TaxID=2726188 RepID=UPI001626ACF5|nr:CpsB/CapC family capsule biosynthesis tyrosine phosphatase [Clostridium sp. DJ247]MBC2581555.1 exopolysaccharide biosynthesis protein [Clostridium sp. DJ247]